MVGLKVHLFIWIKPSSAKVVIEQEEKQTWSQAPVVQHMQGETLDHAD
jgi:hypothetical protein